ncbi:MAG: hypothetical protein JNL43_11995 [Flavobacteriales bacterium]|nr:hypothetical protein [Flavobacteriales bacterium]
MQFHLFSLALPGMLLLAQHSSAQDNQYWTQQQGARATLMGGAATASSDDQSTFFYNPAGTRHVKSAGITASGSFVYQQWYKVKDMQGLGFTASDQQADVAPRLLAGSFDPERGGRWRISFGYVSDLYSRFEVDQAASYRLERDAAEPGTELTTSLLNIITTSRHDLVGLGACYSLGPKSSVGLSLFGTSFTQRYLRTVDLGRYGDPALNDTVPTLAGYISTERGDIYNFGFLAKLGYLHSSERTKWGFALTLPRLSTAFFTGTMYRASTTTRPDGSVEKHLLSGEELATRFNTPLMLDAGVETHLGTAVWALRVGYCTGVAAYDRMILHAKEDLTLGALPPADGTLRRVRSASIPIVNVAMGAQFRLSNVADLLAGVRTDFNHLDRSVLDPATDIAGTFSYWDLYHLSCGVALHSERVKLTTGLVYSVGRDTGTPEDFRLAGDFLSAAGDVPFRTTYNQLGLTFGFSYFVLGNSEPAPQTP